MNDIEFRSVRGRASGDQLSDSLDDMRDSFGQDFENVHPLETPEALAVHKKLLNWYLMERDRQAENRLQMSMDADFYDSIQWDPEDAASLRDRGQMPLVYNEIAPMIDWLIGTQRRAPVDWKILPRCEDDVQMADVKTKVLKYVSDVNHVTFVRSRAFADAVKSGVGWMDDGARDDPTQDILYSKYEDWRNVLWDSLGSYEPDLSDARYLFRWRWVDEDVALMMFPDSERQIMAAMANATSNHNEAEEDTWYTAEQSTEKSGKMYASGSSMVNGDGQRRRVRLIEAQFRQPAKTRIVMDGPMKGQVANENDAVMMSALAKHGASLAEKVMMRVHFAVFTETDMIAMGPSVFRHNRFSLTPIWCYRRGRDRQPYGAIRRVRDIQMDLNKRASKALFLLNTNQIIMEKGAVDDLEELRDEADRPDGMIIKNPNKQLEIRRDTDAATGQIQMMTLDANNIQKLAGVADENMGRQTNAVSGTAIQARQMQGSVVTTEPFDNLRYAIQIQGEKQMSMIEQFYTEEKVIRLTGAKGKLDWVHINKPDVAADGSVTFLNDISASMADFVVSEQDYNGTLRQVMFDSLQQMAARLPPEVSLRLLTMAMEFSDLPNKDEIADQIRKMTGDRDPNKEMTQEEQQQVQQQMQQQSKAMQQQQEMTMLTLQEQQAKVREINAKAAQIEAQIQSESGQEQGGMPPEIAAEIQRIQSEAANQIDTLSNQLNKAQSELANRTLQINKEADSALEVKRIETDGRIRVAEIQDRSNKTIDVLTKRIDDLMRSFDEKLSQQKLDADTKAKELAASVKEIKTTEKVDEPKENKEMKQVMDSIAQLAEVIAAPREKTIVKDKDGKPIGMTEVIKRKGK